MADHGHRATALCCDLFQHGISSQHARTSQELACYLPRGKKKKTKKTRRLNITKTLCEWGAESQVRCSACGSSLGPVQLTFPGPHTKPGASGFYITVGCCPPVTAGKNKCRSLNSNQTAQPVLLKMLRKASCPHRKENQQQIGRQGDS